MDSLRCLPTAAYVKRKRRRDRHKNSKKGQKNACFRCRAFRYSRSSGAWKTASPRTLHEASAAHPSRGSVVASGQCPQKESEPLARSGAFRGAAPRANAPSYPTGSASSSPSEAYPCIAGCELHAWWALCDSRLPPGGRPRPPGAPGRGPARTPLRSPRRRSAGGPPSPRWPSRSRGRGGRGGRRCRAGPSG